MAAAVRSVRFSDDLSMISHRSTVPVEVRRNDSTVVEYPQMYDDALYNPYDVYTAASIGDSPTVEAQLASGFDPNSLNGSGWSSLMYAAYLGHDLVCATLLNAAATVDLSNPQGQTALMFAATCGNLSVVRLLLKKGANIDKQDTAGDTALAYATSCSQCSVAETLLESGADPNIPNHVGMTPTLSACAIGHELTLLALLQYDGDVNRKNLKGENGEALAFDNPKAIAILKDPPASKRKKSNVPKKTMEVTSLMDLLSRLKLDKYISTFEAENIDLGLFLQLNDGDLTEIGIKAFGPRKKLMNVINRYQKDGTISIGSADVQPPHVNDKDRGITERTAEQVTSELMECQQKLAECQQELRRALSATREHHTALESISEACRQSRMHAYEMLEELRRTDAKSKLEKDVVAVIRNIDNILMKMLELPKL